MNRDHCWDGPRCAFAEKRRGAIVESTMGGKRPQSTTPKAKPRKSKEVILRLDGALVTPEAFKKSVLAFIDLLQAVTEEIARGGAKPQWKMSVRQGSAILAATPVADTATQKTATKIIGTLNSGVRLVNRGETSAPGFNSRALSAVRELALLRNKEVGRIDHIQIKASSGKAVEIVPRNAEFFAKAAGIKEAWGSVEGRLQTISVRGTFQFVVYDSIFDRGVNCFVSEKLNKAAVEAFDKRVCVSGLIRSDRHGRPISIQAEKIRRLRNLDELPPLESFRGMLKPVA